MLGLKTFPRHASSEPFDGFNGDYLNLLKRPNRESLDQISAKFSDGIIFEENYKNPNILDSLYKDGTPILDSEDYSEYYNFYQNFFSEELV